MTWVYYSTTPRTCVYTRRVSPEYYGNRIFYAQHGALSAFSVDLAFSAVTIAVSEPSLLPAAENWYPENSYVLAPSA